MSGMMREPLTVAAVQPVWAGADVVANVEQHARAVEQAGARLVVFPELSLTGYDLAAPSLAANDRRLRPLADACRAAGSVALAGRDAGEMATALLRCGTSRGSGGASGDTCPLPGRSEHPGDVPRGGCQGERTRSTPRPAVASRTASAKDSGTNSAS
ncbi:nitrilase-related carbon-nitrogen hydrolase [Streptomyces sp. NPDC002580]|uniref:nitrilase-related carbon-nitrogen hydrolase n=1 Tax=Streptomyces sp. NPDC002580 TaxID=3364653 RepID=UPI0036BB8A66